MLIETSTTYGREILQGIAQYQKSHARWSVYLDERELWATPPSWLLQRHWDGILCRTTTKGLAESIISKGIPAVDLNDLYTGLGLPRIRSKMQAIGQLGARHLHERGFRHLAFCGFKNETWSTERRDGFFAEAATLGTHCDLYESVWRGKGVPRWDTDQDKIASWIESLPKPVGIMACNDVRGQHVLNACQDSGDFVPEQVAVVGVDNNELLCNFCNPPLSSIQPNPLRIGFEAAMLLDQLMAGEQPDPMDHEIDPIGVVVRQSSDALGIADADVVAAIAFIRENAFSGVTVDQIADQVAVSRSHLERSFRKYLGHSPQHEIRWTQVKRIRQLLLETDLTLASIAKLVGFVHVEYMTVVFKRLTGQSPTAFRKEVKDF
ncbi:Xylose operon regulatory protein [Planctomycetes bacterium CA13]|uniref:Xylose operon regulatory protein n=1 Tax=Novipirellula herctigrandis TaxID=2527986 RepID=A0A5C5YYI9_9BACT|nr:Xylose operon regulatory protein [Planctomycetes bacterium CA13]